MEDKTEHLGCEDYLRESQKENPLPNFENLENICVLSLTNPPCKFQEEKCRTQKDYHKCIYYRRYIKERVIKEFEEAEKKRRMDNKGYYS